jgi:hypothetical protein
VKRRHGALSYESCRETLSPAAGCSPGSNAGASRPRRPC